MNTECFRLTPSPVPSKRETKTTTKPSYGICFNSMMLECLGTQEQEPLACVRRAGWGVLYADDAGIVSKSAEGLATMMTAILTVIEEARGIGKKRQRLYEHQIR